MELVRLAGPALKDALFWVFSEMWEEASLAEEGRRGGFLVRFVQNGSLHSHGCQFSNYRNLVMRPVSAKLVARIVASRMNRWLEDKLPKEQNGFRTGRGIDDVHMFFRRILEEVSVADVGEEGGKHVGLTCFSIVRAYTRVCRLALWQLLHRMGIPPAFLSVPEALHEHTKFRPSLVQRIPSCGPPHTSGKTRSTGCPLWHGPGPAVVLQEHVTGTGNARLSSRGARNLAVGDVEFADVATLLAEVDELRDAEVISLKPFVIGSRWSIQENERSWSWFQAEGSLRKFFTSSKTGPQTFGSNTGG